MAPEQKATPQKVDRRADIYSLGVVFYEMLTGELPGEKLQPPSRKVQIDVRLDEIVLRALEQKPERRYQTAAEMRTQVVTVANTPAAGRQDGLKAPPPLASTVADTVVTGKAEREMPWKRLALTVGFHAGLWIVLVGSLSFYIPRLLEPMRDLQAVLPAHTAASVGFVRFLQGYWFLLLPLLIGLDFAICAMLEHLGKRRWRRGWSAAVISLSCLMALGLLVSVGGPAWLGRGKFAAIREALRKAELKNAPRVARTEERLRREMTRKLAEAGWQVEGLFVSVSPDLKRAECRFGKVLKGGFRYVPFNASLRLKAQGAGLWLVEGDGEFRDVRFSVDTSAELLGGPQPGSPSVRPAPRFGPLLDRVVNDLDERQGNEALDLRTGRLSSIPAAAQTNRAAFDSWMKTNQMDLLVDFARNRWALLSVGLKLAECPNAQWDAATQPDLASALAAPPTLERIERGGQVFYLLPTNVHPPLTLAFETQQGHLGLLQIRSFTVKPSGVVFRYKLALAVAAPQTGSSAPFPSSEKHSVTLTNGVSVEVVAVCRNPRQSPAWWKPDGTLLAQPPVGIVKLHPPHRGSTVPPENEFLVCLRWKQPTASGVWQERLRWQPAQDEPRTPVTVRDRATGKEYSTAMICFKQPPVKVDLQVNAAMASWEPVAVFDGQRTRSPLGTMTCSVPAKEGDSLWFDITHDHDRTQFALRMKARLKDGREVEGDVFDEGGKEAVKARARLFLRRFTAADVKEYVFERTRWLQGEMRGIALAPQKSLQPGSDPATRIDRPTATETNSEGFVLVRCNRGETTAMLSHGGSVRLNGLGRDGQWWSLDGTPSHEVLEWKNRFNGNPPGTVVGIVEAVFPDARPPAAKIGPCDEKWAIPFYTVVHPSAAPDGVWTMPVGFGAGPWKTVGRLDGHGQIKHEALVCTIDRIESTRRRNSDAPLVPGAVAVHFSLTFDKDMEAALLLIRKPLRVENLTETERVRLQATYCREITVGLTWGVTSHLLEQGQRWSLREHVDVDVDDIDHFELRVRPRAWALFEGFAMEPRTNRADSGSESPSTRPTAPASDSIKAARESFAVLALLDRTFEKHVQARDAVSALACLDAEIAPNLDRLVEKLAGTELEQRARLLKSHLDPIRAALLAADWEALNRFVNPDPDFESDLQRLAEASPRVNPDDWGPAYRFGMESGPPGREHSIAAGQAEAFMAKQPFAAQFARRACAMDGSDPIDVSFALRSDKTGETRGLVRVDPKTGACTWLGAPDWESARRGLQIKPEDVRKASNLEDGGAAVSEAITVGDTVSLQHEGWLYTWRLESAEGTNLVLKVSDAKCVSLTGHGIGANCVTSPRRPFEVRLVAAHLEEKIKQRFDSSWHSYANPSVVVSVAPDLRQATATIAGDRFQGSGRDESGPKAMRRIEETYQLLYNGEGRWAFFGGGNRMPRISFEILGVDPSALASGLPVRNNAATATNLNAASTGSANAKDRTRLQFRLVTDASDTAPADTLADPNGKKPLRVRREVLLDETAIASATMTKAPADGHFQVEVTFTEAGSKRFGEITGANIRKRLAMIFDGQVLSAPVIMAELHGKAVITGNLAAAMAEAIVKALNPVQNPGRPETAEAGRPAVFTNIQDFVSALAGQALAQELKNVQAPASAERLASNYIAAINAKDRARLIGLVHPRCLAGLSALEQQFMDECLEREFKWPIPEDHKVAITPVSSNSVFGGMLGAMTWRIEPTHQLQVDFRTGTNGLDGVCLIRHMVEDRGAWFLVLPLLNEDGLKRYADFKARQTNGHSTVSLGNPTSADTNRATHAQTNAWGTNSPAQSGPRRTGDSPLPLKKVSAIQWKSDDCSAPLLLPARDYSVSQFGQGKYRIDNWRISKGQFNNIFITFQATNSLSPAAVSGASASTFAVKDQKVTWRSYKTAIEGRSVIRKEALLPNTLPRQKQGNHSDYIAIRMDADSPAILDELTPVAEGILQDSVAVKAGP